MIEMRKGIMLKFRCEFLSSMVAALAITVLFLNIVLPLVLPSLDLPILRNMTSYTLKGCFCFLLPRTVQLVLSLTEGVALFGTF